ncbi:MAG: hypothetical protein SP4CHLAM5_04530 [Chlamydiia bacterium]|nr:hypothetical protein [Chlamydiia bacterium]MCH9618326.1 hypothetical protein [Chlamydiia bacterium]MCH9624498.1 hypothetical protein [Chlamydiia bacterium]
MSYFIFLSLCFLGCTLSAAEEIDVSQTLHIEELMPRRDQVTFIAIDPAIPREYVALSKSGKINYFGGEWVYWGPEEVLKSYFKDESSLSVPVLFMDFTPNYSQKKRGVLDVSKIKKEIEGIVKNLKITSGKWGEYPYCTMSYQMGGKDFNTAYVGLNQDSGATLYINLLSPNVPGGKAIGLKFWNDFFENTKQLSEPLCFRVCSNQELHPGYTIVDIAGRKIKVLAEKRKSDGKVQFIVLPEDEASTFKFENAFKTIMSTNWHLLDPVLKVKGTFVIEEGWINYSMTTTVLIKEVESFTCVSNKNKKINSIFIKTI